MTIGDIIEKMLGLFGREPTKLRRLRERISGIKINIKNMEDELRDIHRDVVAFEKRISELKLELKTEKSEHCQDLIMDDIDRLEKEFGHKRDLSNLKGENLEAARLVLVKLEQLLENAVHGTSADELSSVLENVELMEDDMKDVRKLVEELDRPSSASPVRRDMSEEKEKEDRAARRARILGEGIQASVEKATQENSSPAAAKATSEAATVAETAAANGGDVSVG